MSDQEQDDLGWEDYDRLVDAMTEEQAKTALKREARLRRIRVGELAGLCRVVDTLKEQINGLVGKTE